MGDRSIMNVIILYIAILKNVYRKHKLFYFTICLFVSISMLIWPSISFEIFVVNVMLTFCALSEHVKIERKLFFESCENFKKAFQ